MTTVETIQRIVASSFGISLLDMSSDRRMRSISRPRQVAMYLARHLTKYSLPQIGRRFGGRDHTTILYAVNHITDLMIEDEAFCFRVLELSDQLQQEPDAL